MNKLNSYEIIPNGKLYGTIKNQTSKNATLPILSSSILCDKGLIKIIDYPKITDIENMLSLLKKIGVKITKQDKNLILDTSKANNAEIDCELTKTMRSSLFLLGPMLSKFKSIILTMPGGCAIGKRPIDIHINAFKRLGVKVNIMGEFTVFDAENAHSGKIRLRIPSVGATENIIQFACKLKGKTIIYNPAREPEIVDLANFLNQMGAKIIGAGTKKITIYGVDKLNGVVYKPIGDRIVAGTLACAVAICGGDVTITNACPYQNLKLIEIMRSIGCQIDIKNDIIHIIKGNSLLSTTKIETGYYPNFPTDLQSVMLTVSCFCGGETIIKENVFENRFLTIKELQKMGAKIKLVNNKVVKIKGVEKLVGNTIVAKDLRGGASLVLAGLIADGKTKVENIHFIDRGYENLEGMLNSLGANIRRV